MVDVKNRGSQTRIRTARPWSPAAAHKARAPLQSASHFGGYVPSRESKDGTILVMLPTRVSQHGYSTIDEEDIHLLYLQSASFIVKYAEFATSLHLFSIEEAHKNRRRLIIHTIGEEHPMEMRSEIATSCRFGYRVGGVGCSSFDKYRGGKQ